MPKSDAVPFRMVSVLADWAIRAQTGRWGGEIVWGFYHHLLAFFFFFPSLSKFSVLFTLNFVSLLNSLFGLIIVFCTLLSLRHKKWVSL